tara:strand:+ start:582 stop:2534 length:1953 start_codon:yes stop_codon:yes gene_type:complete
MAFQLSPGVNVSEIDLTTIVPSVATSIGATAGQFAWGPANEVTTISDEVILQARFGNPDNGNFEYWFSAANFLAYGNNLKVVRAVSKDHATGSLNAAANVGGAILIENDDDYDLNHSTANTSVGPFAAKYAGNRGNSLRISICPSANAFSQNLSAANPSAITANALNYLVDNTLTINYKLVNANGMLTSPGLVTLIEGDKVSVDGGTTFKNVVSVNTTAIVVDSAFTANIANNAIINRKWQYADDFKIAPGTSDYATGRSGVNDELHVAVVDEDAEFSGTANTMLEKYQAVSKAGDALTGEGSSNFYKNVINEQSEFVWWQAHQNGGTNWGNDVTGTTFTAVNTPFSASLVQGANGAVSTANVITAFGEFKDPASVDINLIVTGPAVPTVAADVIDNIALTRKDCMVFLSPERADALNNPGSEATDIIAYRNTLTSTSFGFMDSGYKYQYDKYNDIYRYVPLNGDMAGLCVRTDLERDPFFSPAGLNRGIIKNVIKLGYNPSKADRDDLYSNGINPIVSFQGEGTVLFGDKTMQSKPSAFDRINVRRLFILLEKAISRAARFSLFEFNDQFTRSQFVSLVEPFLRDIQGRRGITDFRVVCDESNNTGEVIDRNEFVGDIYIKPARSINFIQLNFVAVRTGVSFDEIVGRF